MFLSSLFCYVETQYFASPVIQSPLQIDLHSGDAKYCVTARGDKLNDIKTKSSFLVETQYFASPSRAEPNANRFAYGRRKILRLYGGR